MTQPIASTDLSKFHTLQQYLDKAVTHKYLLADRTQALFLQSIEAIRTVSSGTFPQTCEPVMQQVTKLYQLADSKEVDKPDRYLLRAISKDFEALCSANQSTPIHDYYAGPHFTPSVDTINDQPYLSSFVEALTSLAQYTKSYGARAVLLYPEQLSPFAATLKMHLEATGGIAISCIAFPEINSVQSLNDLQELQEGRSHFIVSLFCNNAEHSQIMNPIYRAAYDLLQGRALRQPERIIKVWCSGDRHEAVGEIEKYGAPSLDMRWVSSYPHQVLKILAQIYNSAQFPIFKQMIDQYAAQFPPLAQPQAILC